MSSPIVETREPTTEDIKRARYFHLGKRLQAWLYSLKEEASNLPQTIKSLPLFATARSMQNVLDASEARRVCWMLVMINCGVYLAWKIRRLQPAMSKGFTHNPLSGKSYTLLTSMFSHSSFWHLLLNSMALLSFSATAAQHLIREQRKSPSGMQEATVSYHLWAFFICTGLFANLFSHIAQARIIYPRLLARIASPSTPAKGLFRHMVNENTQIRGSLGASGAIYGSVVLTALAFPEAEVSLFFPPGLTLPIQWGVGGLVLLDITGILRGWRYFDHWAHLGGAIFGMLYYNYGPLVWEKTREAMKVTVDKARVERQAKYIQKLEAEYEKVISQADRKKPREV
ncbi:hypothetical protein GLOTRDRAFT_75482 [Gloeophyllum trabeum ATCC 11539]|uniref:Peptidase S54 rhomboid domain-containing protein n=1 Tax=Gloeophyllum trabeum (strain ATCC 11539 / FP-39264 / Madison 617) TaxID=670483 RepID=S7QBE3_GLOTA|nr:uncharacterized protein GLOTRDRAFT_75482 [Gloeophyllum trabeum ATCC 11539]EPQ56667.1 hypothetical protein GLOTRDRAFT_75482 [Gloeophyllum trabeum ATCC 11539]